MQEHKASETAALTAMLRAAHQLLDDKPSIVDDPIAIRLLDDATRELITVQRADLLSPRLMILRAAVLLRTRYAEDLLARAIERGVGQFVIIGAGLDTFAYRQTAMARSLQIYEVDHPATQAWKRHRLAAAGIAVPDNLHWVPVNLERQRLTAGLRDAGFDASTPAFFSVLGVSQYLSLSAIDALLKMVGALPSPSTIVLSFILPDADLPTEEAAVARAGAEDAAKKSEPWLTRVNARELAVRLSEFGFREVIHLPPQEADARYFAGRRDSLRAPQAAQLISATV